MALPLHLRTYQEPSKQDQARLFFNVPTLESLLQGGTGQGKVPVLEKSSQLQQGASEKEALAMRGEASGWQEMEISAVLSVEGKDEVYVCLYDGPLIPAFLGADRPAFPSLPPSSAVRETIPPSAVFMLHLARQTVRPVHVAAVHHQTGRTA